MDTFHWKKEGLTNDCYSWEGTAIPCEENAGIDSSPVSIYQKFTRIVFKALQSHTALEFDYEKFTSCWYFFTSYMFFSLRGCQF